ncbi:Similar to Ino80: Chromatin-remodeling ATPase INO80 (Drosophila melanogaster) [Cotesia congregata]|uniref:Chromatin-remodeling ATPase INO80 n=1 Tax=Cotesia congregata TaxID=51543 RepID=A0A8J2HII1_COTCN|nr:Similar to Ino80: Chromatin-remodeling ATPase INO80 (Drosophila melanogaster) [Cotesia congregata]
MNEQNCSPGVQVQMAIPLHLQRLERSLNVQPFLSQVNHLFQDHLHDEGDNDDNDDDKSISSDSSDGSDTYANNTLNHKEEERMNKLRLYNMSKIGDERRWLQDILLSESDTESVSVSESSDTDGPITEQDFQDMLKFHILRKKYQGRFYQKPENIQYQYYGAGLLSSCDRFPEHQTLIVGNKKKKEKKSDKKLTKARKDKTNHTKSSTNICDEHDYPENEWGKMTASTSGSSATTAATTMSTSMLKIKKEEEELDEADLDGMIRHQQRSRNRKKHNTKSPEVMAMRRRKIWVMMSKKELGKVQRAKINNHKEMLINCKKLSQNCMKYWRQKAMQSQKNMKETLWRAKRLTREMQSYWKRYDRVERETRKRLEKEAEEQRKMDVELIEAKRQQRKLNFLITQTELYAHFMSKKIGKVSPEEQLRILNQLDEEKNPRLIGIDDYDSELMKQKAKRNATEAFDYERARTRQFDSAAGVSGVSSAPAVISPLVSQELRLSDTPENLEHPQPSIFKGNLKGYQLKGMNWLANLYDQGISGILADEMGLGKTVQSIAFLCHVAERYSVWGPFLIISPASTLHNWQQEMARFVPSFKVVPYWGNPQERKILRQFWDTKDLHTKDASFHVVITSYQLVITDYKYFNRIKWQYMILDEAQAIKSTSSMRWKLLLGFSCRNRLLLSGTPIQNSMAELWALLHFIMPTLFDSHDEFNEWFSKDIESHAENKTGIDEKHLSRLHMILKPFMLRRIKKDVENELSDKIEIMVYCPLTTRQKLLYSALKQKIRVEDLLHYSVGAGGNGENPPQNDKNFTSNLMNLVMQFRKVCNHPELFERRDAKSPLFFKTIDYQVPAVVYKSLIFDSVPSKEHLLFNKFSVFNTEYINKSLNHDTDDFVAFTRLMNISPVELHRIFVFGILYRLYQASLLEKRVRKIKYWEDWSQSEEKEGTKNLMIVPRQLVLEEMISIVNISELIFTKKILQGEPFYTHTTHVIHAMPETMAHRIIRSTKHVSNTLKLNTVRVNTVPGVKPQICEESKFVLLPEHRHLQRADITREYQPTSIPRFLCDTNEKIKASPRKLYVSSSSAAYAWKRHEACAGPFGQNVLWTGFERTLRNFDTDVESFHKTSVSQINILDNSPASIVDFSYESLGGLAACHPVNGWSNIIVPDKQTLVTDAGKLAVLDNLLRRLKEQGHRVLIYSQMTKMIDLLEEYMYHRKHTFMRLDGSSKISDRRDMVADFQKRADIFVFLLSTRAGGLGINLTAADTVIFYDSDWNPTVDQQAMDRAHRLGQTKQVTVYRLICKGTIEERILQRAREKSEIQRMVISGGNFKPDTLKPKEVVSLLLDDEEIEAKYSQRSEERKQYTEDSRIEPSIHHKEKDRKRKLTALPFKDPKKPCLENNSVEKVNTCTADASNEYSGTLTTATTTINTATTTSSTTASNDFSQSVDTTEDYRASLSPVKSEDETSNEGLVVDVDNNSTSGGSSASLSPPKVARFNHHLNYGIASTGMRIRPSMRGTSKRGRPRGSRRGGPIAGKGRGLMLHPPGKSSAGTLHSVSSSTSGDNSQGVEIHSEFVTGPGRPRLRPAGPGHQGHRIPGHPKRIQRPLPVPLSLNQLSVQRKSPISDSVPSSSSESRPFGFYTQQRSQQDP